MYVKENHEHKLISTQRRKPQLGINAPAMVGVVEVLVFAHGVGHAGRVAAHNVEVGPCVHASLGVPLHLGGSRIHHRADRVKRK